MTSLNISEELKARGLIEHESAPLEKILEKKRTVYFGIDPTASSATIAHLIPLFNMKRLQDAGHKVIFLVGGGTGMIGDPREKGERSLLDMKTIAKNKNAIKAQLFRIMGKSIHMVDNADWLLKLNLFEFLRDIGKLFTVNDLIKRDLIKRRLDTPDESISFTEFTYSLLQGYDFMMLNKKHGVDLQIGGTDQWTNMLSGVDLIRKKLGREAYVFSNPMVTDGSGVKLSKSLGNAPWLDANLTSVFDFYQYWINTSDEALDRFLKFYTFMPLEEIRMLLERHMQTPSSRIGQKALAFAVTKAVHGEAQALSAQKATEVLFGGGSLSDLSKDDIQLLSKEIPTAKSAVDDSIVDTILEGRLLESKSEVRRLIEAKGLSLNGELITADQKLLPENFQNGVALIRKGKKEALLVLLK